jgi:hypothetical protein
LRYAESFRIIHSWAAKVQVKERRCYETMKREIENAKREIRREIAGQIDWFVPEGEKHFDPVTVIGTISLILISAFLNGFIDEAKKSAEGAGRNTFKNLKELCAKAFEDGEEAQFGEIESDAQQSHEIARALPSSQRDMILRQTEAEFRESLLQFMPKDRVVVIVSQVRTSVVTYILEPKEI